MIRTTAPVVVALGLVIAHLPLPPRPPATPVVCSCAANDSLCKLKNCSAGIGSGTGTGSAGTVVVKRPDETIQQQAPPTKPKTQ